MALLKKSSKQSYCPSGNGVRSEDVRSSHLRSSLLFAFGSWRRFAPSNRFAIELCWRCSLRSHWSSASSHSSIRLRTKVLFVVLWQCFALQVVLRTTSSFAASFFGSEWGVSICRRICYADQRRPLKGSSPQPSSKASSLRSSAAPLKLAAASPPSAGGYSFSEGVTASLLHRYGFPVRIVPIRTGNGPPKKG